MQRNCRNQSGDGRIAPGFVSAVNQWEALAVGYGEIIGGADQQAARGGKALRIADDGFALFAARK